MCLANISVVFNSVCNKIQRCNILRLRRNEQHFTGNIFEYIFFEKNVWIFIQISLHFFLKDPINIIQAMAHRMALRHPGDKPLSEPMMVNLSIHICITQPQWVNPHNAASRHIPGELGPYNGYWCPGFLHHQVISSHSNDYIRYIRSCLLEWRILTIDTNSISRDDVKFKYIYACILPILG